MTTKPKFQPGDRAILRTHGVDIPVGWGVRDGQEVEITHVGIRPEHLRTLAETEERMPGVQIYEVNRRRGHTRSIYVAEHNLEVPAKVVALSTPGGLSDVDRARLARRMDCRFNGFKRFGSSDG